MKQFLSILAAVVVLAGCRDTFLGPEDPPLEPTSDEVVFSVLEYSNSFWQFGGIRVANLATGVVRPLVQKPVYLMCAPQGGRMLYLEFSENPLAVILKLAKTDGTEEEVIQTFTIGEMMIDLAALSPDGQKIVYVVNYQNFTTQSRGYHMVLYNRGSGVGLPQIIDHIDVSGTGMGVAVTSISFSPDSRYLAAVKWLGQAHLQVYSAHNGGVDRSFVNTGPAFAWSDDGKKLIYTENPQLFMYEYEKGNIVINAFSPTSVNIGDVASGVSEVVAEGFPMIWDVTLSHDGKKVALSQYREMPGELSSTTDIISFAVNTPELLDTLTATGDNGFRRMLQWSRDDRQLLYTLSSTLNSEKLYGQIMRINMVGGDRSEKVVEYLAYDGYWYNK